MLGLPDGEKNFRICVTVYTQYRRVTDRQTDILPWHSLRYAYASHGKKHPSQQSTKDYFNTFAGQPSSLIVYYWLPGAYMPIF